MLTFSDAKDDAVIFTAEPSFTGIRMTADKRFHTRRAPSRRGR